ncbi:accessory Sec system glycosyltransferase GtfA [Leuconostoc fallax]|uniref:UDP-N-acetylglucosamine--peptide N-acetylglucosaminyltransferase GtfA subunit n=1 Tax=Leuconostoc fallax TaxID=1251 RepID=A0A4R5N791_9LACO|nr:accessory Sec system glycosyltransferase GtfA [Leuconostoc fallax]MBU7456374.1 accessory Sec system glycosyltransferase GtfA [Leuconostoc fallax]TDG67249.1 hypothetical protein C5L23_000203 [Leuconostoc fallax]
MTVYNFNLGIGWASSGVEYAQLYRAEIFRQLGQPAKFIFMDLITSDNIEHLTHNIGFFDDEIIWIYQYFSDIKVAPTSYSLNQLESTFPTTFDRIERGKNYIRYFFEKDDIIITAYLDKKNKESVERAEFVSHGKLIRKDYYTYTKLFSEYYAPKDNKAYVYERHFFNQNGSIAFEEIVDGKNSVFKFKNQIIYGKEGLLAYMLKCFNFTTQDIIILDRATNIGSTILKYSAPAKVGVVVHAEHFNENQTDTKNILWNNFYEYQFDQADNIDFFITATLAQKKLLEYHFSKYTKLNPRIFDIPVGNLKQLYFPLENRKKHSLITASRLATEKHVDWLIKAVIKSKKYIPDLTFDIYGEGGENQKLKKIIEDNSAQNYIKLRGHVDLEHIYQKYDTYISASTSEGFGLTLMEAVGSGLPMIGFNVRYGNQTFIKNNQNGYLIPFNKSCDVEDIAVQLSNKIITLFEQHDLSDFSQNSYKIAEKYLVKEVEKRWQILINEVGVK